MADRIQTDINREIVPLKPNMYAVIMHNDDYTTMDFVVSVLTKIFHKTDEESHKIMMKVHTTGKSIVGIYTYDIAMSKRVQAESYATENEFPLKITVDVETSKIK